MHDSIERDAQLTILIQHRGQFVARLVAFAALPVAHGPEREHGCLTRQFANASDNAILRTVTIDKVVVDAGCNGRCEGCREGTLLTLKPALAGVVPIKSVAARTGKVGNGNVSVVVPQFHLASTPAHCFVMQLSKTIDVLVNVLQ